MKNKIISLKWITIAMFTIVSYNMHAQGIIDFGSGRYYTILIPDPAVIGRYNPVSYYSEKGFLFNVVVPTLGTTHLPGYDTLSILSGELSNYPYNSTAYLSFEQYRSPDDYVSFSQTSGNAFGLTSVDLANWPLSSVDLYVTFDGTKNEAGVITTVSQTFDLPAGSPFTTYYFDPVFFSGLVSVDIKTSELFMDNLTFIPEPASVTLLAFGFLAGFQAFRKRKHRQ